MGDQPQESQIRLLNNFDKIAENRCDCFPIMIANNQLQTYCLNAVISAVTTMFLAKFDTD